MLIKFSSRNISYINKLTEDLIKLFNLNDNDFVKVRSKIVDNIIEQSKDFKIHLNKLDFLNIFCEVNFEK